MSDRKILRLTAENFMRLKAVSISPSGDVVYITGANGEGKSSILNAICAALNWRDISGQIPEPIHQGEKKAVVSLDLGDMTITRTWTPSGSQLKVESKDGAVYKSPQAMLDKFFSSIGFDPLEFIRMQPKDQRQSLMDLLGIDFSEYDREREARLLQKKELIRDIQVIKRRLQEYPEIPDALPDDEISAEDLLNQMNEAREKQNKIDSLKNIIETADHHIAVNIATIKEHETEIERLKGKISDLERVISVIKSKNTDYSADIENCSQQIKSIVIPDIEPVKEQFKQISTINKYIQLKKDIAILNEKLQNTKDCLNHIELEISDIDQDKRDCLESAKFPVKGLGFDESGVLFQGIPLKQASSAEQIRVSLAIGIAMNPAMKVLLIRDGSLLDSKTRGLVAEMAAEHGMQVWIEAVDESGKVGFVVEDGSLKQVSSGQQVIA